MAHGAPVDAADAALVVRLAAAHAAFGRRRRAADLCGLALWIDPDGPEALELAAVLALRDGRMAEALEFSARRRVAGGGRSELLALVERRARAVGG